MPSLLLAGCGDIALRVAPLLAERFAVTGLRRNTAVLPAFIEPLTADVTDAPSVATALRGQSFDYAVITLTPGERTAAAYHRVYVDGTTNLLAALAPGTRVLFVSSTSVYGQDAGEWVDEHTPAVASGFAGQALLAAEQRVAASGLPYSCVRCSGIYGPGRGHLLQQVRAAEVKVARANQVSNRIHADDVAGVLAFLITRWERGQAPDPCYLASDPCPTPLGEVWQWLVERLGSPLALPAGWAQVPMTGKHCSSVRLQQQGFCWQYPDFRAGYAALLAAE